MKLHRVAAFAAGCICAHGAPSAASDSSGLSEIAIVGTRLKSSVAAVTGGSFVIDRGAISARAPADVAQLLMLAPGLHVEQPGGRGGIGSIYLRGADPNATLVLIDGVPLNDPTNSRGGSFDVAGLDPFSIEHIEIASGPLSVVHGGGALGGAINIVTREPSAQHLFHGMTEAGTSGGYRAAAVGAGPIGSGGYAVTVTAANDGPARAGAFTSHGSTAKWTFSPADTTAIEVSARYAESIAKSFPDDSGGPRHAVRRDRDRRDGAETTIGATLEHRFSALLGGTLRLSHYGREESATSPGVAPGVRDPFGIPPNRNATDFRRRDVLAALTLETGVLQLTGGAAAAWEKGSSDGALTFPFFAVPVVFENSRRTFSVFAETEAKITQEISVYAGARADFVRGLAREINPRVGLSYAPGAGTTRARMSWSEGFKPASFYALGHPIIGSPFLRPEASQGADFSVETQVMRNGLIKLALFSSRYRDLIDFEEGPPPRLVNRSVVESKGAELSAEAAVLRTLRLRGFVSHADTEVVGTNEPLRGRPRWRGGVGMEWVLRPAVQITGDLLYVGAIPDSSIPTGDVVLEKRLQVNAALTWSPTSRWRVTAAVSNLLDARYQEAAGFDAPGAAARVRGEIVF